MHPHTLTCHIIIKIAYIINMKPVYHVNSRQWTLYLASKVEIINGWGGGGEKFSYFKK